MTIQLSTLAEIQSEDYYSDVDPHTRSLLEQIGSADQPYTARYRGIDIEVFPRVFFPLPYSSRINGITGSDIRSYNGKRVLDLGSGTGIRSVVAGLSGAKEVIAVDIVEEAVENTNVNVNRYNLQDKITVVHSDLFDNVIGSFDVIIGYLPLVQHDVREAWELAIFDPSFLTHKRFFAEVKNYLNKNGIIKMVHSNKGDVDYFESLIKENYLEISKKSSSYKFDLEWHFYNLRIKV